MTNTDLAGQIQAIRTQYPENLMARHFDADYFNSLRPELQQRLERMIITGVKNPDSHMGAYAMHPDDYDVFQPYLDKMIRDYHGIKGELKQISDWDTGDILDLAAIDPSLADTSMRVRVGRNLSAFPLPGAMTREDRIAFEGVMVGAFEKLMAHPDFGGSYVSLTPGSQYEISHQRYLELVAEHKMFKDMSADTYLSVAGISSDWPLGRGMYVSADEQFIVWVGEEDHLRIMAMKRGAILNEIFDRLHASLDFLEAQGLQFARSATYGAVTSCPTNLGTGMRASLHVGLPRLTENGAKVDALKPLARKLGLSVRGADGEHTPAGAGGIVDLSPSARLMITEAEIAGKLYQGVKAMWALEQQA